MDKAESPRPIQAETQNAPTPESTSSWKNVIKKATSLFMGGALVASTAQPVHSAPNSSLSGEKPTSGDPSHTMFDASSRQAPDVMLPQQNNDENAGHDINPITHEVTPRQEPQSEGVPADQVDLNNIYVKHATEDKENAPEEPDLSPPSIDIDGNGKGPNGEDILPQMKPHQDGMVFAKASSDAEDEPVSPPKIKIDGNSYGTDGSDVLPMTRRGEDSDVLAKTQADSPDSGSVEDPGSVPQEAPVNIDGNGRGPNGEDIYMPDGPTTWAKADSKSPTEGALPVPPSNTPDAVPMMRPTNPDEVARIDSNSVTDGTLPLPESNLPDPLPMSQPGQNQDEFAKIDPTKGIQPPERPKEEVLPLMPKKDDGSSIA